MHPLVSVLMFASLALASGCAVGASAMPRPFELSRANAEWLGVPDVKAGPRRRFLAWAASEPYLLVVHKGERSLSVYRHGRALQTYPVVFGRNDGRKLYEGDRRTPSGVYRITKKRPHYRFHRFLDFDYPNADDLENYRRAVAHGIVPKKGSAPVSPGRLLGIHGSDKPELNRVGIDWTYGCVALVNEDVEKLYEIVPEGTLLLIRDGEAR